MILKVQERYGAEIFLNSEAIDCIVRGDREGMVTVYLRSGQVYRFLETIDPFETILDLWESGLKAPG